MIITLPENEEEHAAAFWDLWDKSTKIIVLPYLMSNFRRGSRTTILERVKSHVKDKLKTS